MFNNNNNNDKLINNKRCRLIGVYITPEILLVRPRTKENWDNKNQYDDD